MKLAFLTSDNRQAHRQYDNPVPWFGTAMEALLQGFAERPGLEVHVVTCTQQPMQSPAKLAGNIYFYSLHVPKIGWMRTLYRGCIRATRRKLREIQPDIVHGQGTERDCSISAVLSGFPNVMTIHGNMRVMAELARSRPFSFHWLAARLEAFSLRRTAGVFCNSRYTEELVRPLNPVTWRVPNALRSAVFAPKAAPPPAIPPTRLINVGVISPRKRQLELLEVFRRLWERGYAAEIEFVGLVDSSAYGVEFLRAIRQPGVEAFARHLEFQEMPQLLAAFDRAHGSVHFPSEEAFGLVVGEALARNLKFFGARVGGVVEIAEAVEGAELIAVDDWAGLEQRLADWVEQGSARPHEAAPVMRERYHPDVVARRHMEIYREVLAGRAG